jgi:hypothetical protein
LAAKLANYFSSLLSVPATFLTTADFVEENIEFELNFVVGSFFSWGRLT